MAVRTQSVPTGFTRVLVILLVIVSLAVLGYMTVEGLNFAEAMYMTMATLTTVGYGDIVPHTAAGRWLSIGVMLSGVSFGFYAVGLLAATLVEGRLGRLVEERRMRKAIESLSEHFVICGYGQVGRRLARELERLGADLVVVERDGDRVAAARNDGCLVIHGDATDEDVLTEARIAEARGLASLISDDAENLYITVSSRTLHPDLPIVARASRPRGSRYLSQAGATTVINLDQLGASRIARSLLRPDVVMFLEEMMGSSRDDVQLETLRLRPGCGFAGETLEALALRRRFGAQVLAVKRKGRYVANPGPAETLEEGDVIVVVGPGEGLSRLADAMMPPAAAAQ